MTSLAGKTLLVTGGSRGIGLAIAKRAAVDGANIIIAAKTSEPHPTLPGTIHTAAVEIEEAGGKALPLVCDIRDEKAVRDTVEKGAGEFGGIDILVNMLGGDELIMHSRRPDIMADAAYVILNRASREFTGHFCVDDSVLEDEGITDLSNYAVNPELPLAPDFFVEPKNT